MLLFYHSIFPKYSFFFPTYFGKKRQSVISWFKCINECDNAIDYYADMLDLGITPTMVGKYIGKEYEMRMLIDCASYNLLSREECLNYIKADLIW